MQSAHQLGPAGGGSRIGTDDHHGAPCAPFEDPAVARSQPATHVLGHVHERTISFGGDTQAFLDNRVSRVVHGPQAAVPVRTGLADALARELGALCPARRRWTTRVADFFLRRTPGLGAGAVQGARLAHESRQFTEFLKLEPAPARPEKDAGRAIAGAMRRGKGAPDELFKRAQAFAAGNRQAVCALMARGYDDSLREIRRGLLLAGVPERAASAKAEVIHAGLVAQLASDNEAERVGHFEARLRRLHTSTEPVPQRLKLLIALGDDLARETRLSPGAAAAFKLQVEELRTMCEQASAQHGLRIAAATAGLTTATSAHVLQERLAELDGLSEAMALGSDLSPEEKSKLDTQLSQARELVHCLQARPSVLQELAAQPRLKAAIGALDVSHYMKAQRGLSRMLECVGPGEREAVLAQLDAMVVRPDQTPWLDAIARGDADIIDVIFPGADWDDVALSFKQSAIAPSDARALLDLDVQHNLHICARELDLAMQADVLKKKPGHAKFPHNAFRALKADATLVGWLANNAGSSVTERDLMIAKWIGLSLYEPSKGMADPGKVKELLARLGLQDIETREIERHIDMGFASTRDVLACREQILKFSRSVQATSLLAAEHPTARAERVCLDLLRSVGIDASHPLEEGLAAKLNALVRQKTAGPLAPPSRAAAADFLRTVRRIAILQEAVASGDAAFKCSASAGSIPNTVSILKRMAGFGITEGAREPIVREAAAHAADKLSQDERPLSELCGDFDPGTAKNRVTAGLKSLFLTGAASAPPPAVSPAAPSASDAEKRRQENEGVLNGRLSRLKPNEVFTVRFGAYGGMSASAPAIPGLSVNLSTRIDIHNSIVVGRMEDGAFSVQLHGGREGRGGISIAAIRDALNLTISADAASGQGHTLTFDTESACGQFLAAIASGDELPARAWAARRVASSSQASAHADARLSASADLLLASLNAEIAAGYAVKRDVRQTANGQIELYAREIDASAAAGASLAGGLGSVDAGAAVHLGVKRQLVRQHGMLQSGSELNVTAKVMRGNVEGALQWLLPDLPADERNRLQAQIGTVDDGAELFVRYELADAARRQANRVCAEARVALTDAVRLRDGTAARTQLLDQAARRLDEADRATRDFGNYRAVGFGWTVINRAGAESSMGPYTKYAQGSAAATRFSFFDEQTVSRAAPAAWAAALA